MVNGGDIFLRIFHIIILDIVAVIFFVLSVLRKLREILDCIILLIIIIILGILVRRKSRRSGFLELIVLKLRLNLVIRVAVLLVRGIILYGIIGIIIIIIFCTILGGHLGFHYNGIFYFFMVFVVILLLYICAYHWAHILTLKLLR